MNEYMRMADRMYDLDNQFEQLKKKNTELEKENAELRNNGFTVSAMTEQQLKVALEKGEQLEKENAKLKKKLKEKLKTIADKDLSFVAKFDALESENAELKAQIEKMKCCGNCSHRRYWGNELGCKLDLDKQFECDNNNKKYWEFKEE